MLTGLHTSNKVLIEIQAQFSKLPAVSLQYTTTTVKIYCIILFSIALHKD